MFQKYHFSEGAKKVTSEIPGPKSKELLKKQDDLEGNNVSYPKGVPIAFDKAKGSSVVDVDGNVYIDFFSSCGVLNFGHNNPDILKDVYENEYTIMQAVDFPTKNKIAFMEQLLSMLPETMSGKYKMNFGGPTGSDAVETAIKLARINKGRHSIISFQGSYHGMTMGALSVTSDLSHRKDVVPLIPGVHFMPYCSSYRCPMDNDTGNCDFSCLSFLKNSLENPHSGIDKPAAIIIEPIQGEGGGYIPKNGWLEEVVNLARQNDILVIFDEVQTGFFRTGKLFAFEHTNVIPDIVIMSKGIGGIGFPLSLILYKKELDTWKSGTHIGTFRGNQLGMIAGLSAMKLSEDINIESHVNVISNLMSDRLKQIEEKFDFIGDIRVRGMMFGIEYVKNRRMKEPAPELAKKIRKLCYEDGLLVEIGGYYNNVIRFLPPLVITGNIAINGLNIFENANKKLLIK